MSKRILTCAACCLALLSGMPAWSAAPVPAHPSMPGRAVDLPDKGTAVLRLTDAVLLGLANNSEIRAAYLERVGQKATLRAAEERFLPKLALNGSHVVSQNLVDRGSRTEFSPTATLQNEYGTRFNLSWNNRITQDDHGGTGRKDGASFTVVQPLMRGAGREIATAPLRQAQLNEQISQLGLNALVSDVVTQIIIAYHEVLRAQEQSSLAQKALWRANRSLSDEGYKAAAGYWVESDFDSLDHAESDVASQELALEEAGHRLETNRQLLLRLMGLEADTKIYALDDIETSYVQAGFAKTFAAALKQQPRYLMQRLVAERAAIDLTVARDQRRWDVSLVGGSSQTRSYTFGSAGSQVDQSRDSHAGIRIDIPIGDDAPRQAEVRARVNARNQDMRLADARQALERDIRDAVRDVDARWKQYEIACRALDLTRTKLKAERERARKMPPDSFRMLIFEADLYKAETARIDTLIAYRNALAALDRVSGSTLESWQIELND